MLSFKNNSGQIHTQKNYKNTSKKETPLVDKRNQNVV